MKPSPIKAVHSGRVFESKNPWYRSYAGAKERCNRKASPSYKRYGGRGIKLLMALSDFKYLWFRDHAYLMDRPSIDRIDNDGSYTLKNCRFIELKENRARVVRDYNEYKRTIGQYTLGGKLVRKWNGIKSAKKSTGFEIDSALHGRTKTSGGYVWKILKESRIKTGGKFIKPRRRG